MKAEKVILNIMRLGIYSPSESAEYLSYFRQEETYQCLLQQNQASDNEIEQRIKSDVGAAPIEPDYDISDKVILPELLMVNHRDDQMCGIMSGAFDLLHLGHIRGMAYAKQYLLENQKLNQTKPPILIVLTLSDVNIAAKKGISRPVLDISERLDMISEVKCVDYIVPLVLPNCIAALELLRPEYFFKTTADRSQEIVRQEMELVEAYGGKVKVFPPQADLMMRSTTSIINTVAGRMLSEW